MRDESSVVGKGGTGKVSLIERRRPLPLTSLDGPAFSTKVALEEKKIQFDSERENRSVKRIFLI